MMKKYILIPIILMFAIVAQAQNDTIVDFPEKEAQFPGGNDSLFRFIQTNLKFPEPDGIHGKVYVRFTISSVGEVSNIKILRGIHKAYDQEVIRVISMLPKWVPAENEGKPVASNFTIPIYFRVQ